MALASVALCVFPSAEWGPRQCLRKKLALPHVELGLRLLTRYFGPKPSPDGHEKQKGIGPWHEVRLQPVQCVERHPEVRSAARRNTGELRRGDADYDEGDLVDRDRAPDDRSIRSQAAPPIAIAHHHNAGIRLVVTRREKAAVLRLDAEHGKEIAATSVGLRNRGRSPVAEVDPPESSSTENAGQRTRVLLEILELRVGEEVPADVGFPKREGRGELDELMGSGHR